MTAILLGGGSVLNGQPIAGVPAHSGSQAAAFSPKLFSTAYNVSISSVPHTASAALTRTDGLATVDFDLNDFWL